MPGSRSYCFTINNPSVDEVNDLFQNDFKYMIIGFETGKKGTPHIQGYLQYYQPVTFNTVKLSLPTAHIEVAKGTPQQNIAYCSKDGDWFEYGEKPTEGGRVTYTQVEAALQDPENNMTILRQYSKTYQEVRQTKISQSSVPTTFFRMAINNKTTRNIQIATDHLLDKIGIPISDLIIVSTIQELSAYEHENFDDKTVVLLHPVMDHILPLYPRGVPIKYRYGYQYHTCKPKSLIVISEFSELLSHYRIYGS